MIDSGEGLVGFAESETFHDTDRLERAGFKAGPKSFENGGAGNGVVGAAIHAEAAHYDADQMGRSVLHPLQEKVSGRPRIWI